MANNQASSSTVLITGANRGIGLELAKAFIAQGHEVWGTAREASPPELLSAGPAGVISFDLADESSIAAGVADLSNRISHLDVLINSAGIDARALDAPIEARGPFDLDADTFAAVTRVNAVGPMVVTREALPLLRGSDQPTVVNISSQLGSMEVAAKLGSDTSYCVSKAALNMLTVKSAAVLGAEGMTVVAVHPGWVSTEMGGETAPLSPADSAAALYELIDNLSPSDNGRFLQWDGQPHPW